MKICFQFFLQYKLLIRMYVYISDLHIYISLTTIQQRLNCTFQCQIFWIVQIFIGWISSEYETLFQVFLSGKLAGKHCSTSKRPDRFKGPPSLLSNGNGIVSRDQRSQSEKFMNSPLSNAKYKNERNNISAPHMPSSVHNENLPFWGITFLF